ncbi:MAG: adenylate/guanylate cyclase domain-containing protein, partial [Actinomycetota bacterium]|nr:adenylate/guanylate cyclase domain-containing protein [Actinomycetota bacterium]
RQDMLLSGTADEAVAQARLNRETVLRDLLPTIHVPTLIAWRADSGSGAISRHVGASIPNATLRELPGRDYALIGGDWRAALNAIEDFLLTLSEREPDADRVLATIMFTDLVGSTGRAAAIGDSGWRQLLERHHAAVRRALAEHRGREIDTAGDGFFAAFDGPARAIRCAQSIRRSVQELGLEIRIGIHAGECERVGGGLRGVAVHIGARIGATAEPGEILVSSTIRDLVAGSGITFEDAGTHHLKGVSDEWRLFRVLSSSP